MLFFDENDANDFTVKDIEDLLDREGEDSSASGNEGPEQNPAQSDGNDKPGNPAEDVTKTQAFAHRLKEATAKARSDERENVAKELGFASYEEMRKASEHNLIREKGFDPDEVSPIVEEIVKKRLADDPRMKELDEFRQKKMEDWAAKELTELTTLTDGAIKSFNDIPKHVIERWKKTGSLKGAYIELEGENLIRSMKAKKDSDESRGSVRHMEDPKGSTPPIDKGNKRPLTDAEKDVYKMFNPGVSEEELNAMTREY